MKISGVIAFIGKPTIDFRTVESLGIRQLPLPLMGFVGDDGKLCNPGAANRGHEGSILVGELTDVQFRRNGAVWAEGRLYTDSLMEGRKRCGVGIDMEATREDPSWGFSMRGHLMGATLNIDSGAWPEAYMEVALDG